MNPRGGKNETTTFENYFRPIVFVDDYLGDVLRN